MKENSPPTALSQRGEYRCLSQGRVVPPLCLGAGCGPALQENPVLNDPWPWEGSTLCHLFPTEVVLCEVFFFFFNRLVDEKQTK